MRMTPGPACLVLGLFLMAAPSVFAQASITGTVRDTSGAVLPGVTVEASSPATPTLLFWYAHTDGEAVRAVARIDTAGDRVAAIRN